MGGLLGQCHLDNQSQRGHLCERPHAALSYQDVFQWQHVTFPILREKMRQAFNEWLRTSPIFDGCIDFDAAVRNITNPKAFADGYDSGDHLHPSEKAYDAMAHAAVHKLIRYTPQYDHEEYYQ